MAQAKESVLCVPVLQIKNQIEQIAFDSIKFHALDIHSDTWNRYPCKLNTTKKCQNDHCHESASFFITNNARKNVKIITLLFVRENESAYVHYNRQLRSLFEDGILNPVINTTIQLKPPVITEPTKKVNPK